MFRSALILFAAVSTVTAGTITLNAISSGFYDDTGAFSSGNYAIGWYGGQNHEIHSYVAFDLSGVSSTIFSATLRLQNPSSGFLGLDPTETWTAFDVSTNLSVLDAGTGGTSAFADLGAGTLYGSLVVVGATANNALQDLLLSAAGVAYLNSALGANAVIGNGLTSLNKVNGLTESLFNSSSGEMTRQLILTTGDSLATPEPSSLLLVTSGLALAAMRMSRRL